MSELARGPLRRLRSLYAIAGALLSIGFVLSILTLFALSELTGEVLEGETMEFDRAVLEWMGSRTERWLELVALEVTALGNTLVLATICVLAATFLRLAGRSDHALLLLVGVAGGAVLNFLLKSIFDRPRPEVFEWRIAHAGLTSFPSGHATMSMVVFSLLAYTLHSITSRRWIEITAMVIAGSTVLMIGLSRVYLGVHYPSDVLAGFGVGFVWAVSCVCGAELIWHLRGRGMGHTPDLAHAGADNNG